jgi:hypothetical protein
MNTIEKYVEEFYSKWTHDQLGYYADHAHGSTHPDGECTVCPVQAWYQDDIAQWLRTTLHAIADEARRECLDEVYAGARHYSFGFSKPLGSKGMCSPDVNRTLVPIEHIDSLSYKKTQ